MWWECKGLLYQVDRIEPIVLVLYLEQALELAVLRLHDDGVKLLLLHLMYLVKP